MRWKTPSRAPRSSATNGIISRWATNHLFTQVAPNAYYAGATEFTSPNLWEEAGKPKGFVLYDTVLAPGRVCGGMYAQSLRPDTDRRARVDSGGDWLRAIQERAEKVNIRNAIVRQRIFNILPEQRSGD